MDELACYDKFNTMWNTQDCLNSEMNVHLVPQYVNDNSDISKSMYSLISYQPTQVPFIEPRDTCTQLFNGCSFNRLEKYIGVFCLSELSPYRDQPIASIGNTTRNPQSVVVGNNNTISMSLHGVDLYGVKGFYLDNLVISPAYGDFIINFLTAEPTVKFIADCCKQKIKNSYSEEISFTVDLPIDLTSFIPVDVTSNYIGMRTKYDCITNKPVLIIHYTCEHITKPEIARERETIYKDLGYLYEYRYMDFYISHDKVIDGYRMPHQKDLHKFIFKDLYLNNADIWDTTDYNKQAAYNRVQDKEYFVPMSLIESKSSAISILHDIKHLVKSLPLDLAQGYGHILSKENNILNDERSIYHTLFGPLLSWFDNSVVTLQRMLYTLADAYSTEFKFYEYRKIKTSLQTSTQSTKRSDIYNFIQGYIGIYKGFDRNATWGNCPFSTIIDVGKTEKKDAQYTSLFSNMFITLQRQCYHRIQPGYNISHFNICQHNTAMSLLPVQDRYEQFRKYAEFDIGSNSYNVSTPSIKYAQGIITNGLSRYTTYLSDTKYLSSQKLTNETKSDKIRINNLTQSFNVNTSFRQDEGCIALEAYTFSDFIFRAASKAENNYATESFELGWLAKPFELFDYDLSTLNNDMQNVILTYQDNAMLEFSNDSNIYDYDINSLDVLSAKVYSDFSTEIYNKDITATLVNTSFLDLPVWYISFIDWSQIELNNVHSYLDGHLVDISEVVKIFENHKSVHTKSHDYYYPNYVNWKSFDCGFTNNQMRFLSLLTNADNVLNYSVSPNERYPHLYLYFASLKELNNKKDDYNAIVTESTLMDSNYGLSPMDSNYGLSDEILQMENPYSNTSCTFNVSVAELSKTKEVDSDNMDVTSYTTRGQRGRVLDSSSDILSSFPRNKLLHPKTCNSVYSNLNGLAFSVKARPSSNIDRVVMPNQVAPSKYLNINTVSNNIDSNIQEDNSNEWVEEDSKVTEKYTVEEKINMLCNKFDEYKSTNIFPVIRLKEEPNKAVIFTKDKVFIFDTGDTILSYALEISYTQISYFILSILDINEDNIKEGN